MANSNHTTILGIGQCGVRVVSRLAQMPEKENLQLLAVDTDELTLAECVLPEEQKILAGFNWEHRGCGGNPTGGNSAIGYSRNAIEEKVRNSDILVIVGGLGGGTASGGLSVLSSIAKDLPTLLVLTLPFELEGRSRAKIAEQTLKTELLPTGQAILLLPNDLVFSALPANTDLSEAFEIAERELAYAVLSLGRAFASRELLSGNLAELKNILNRRRNRCGIGVGLASASVPGAGDRCQNALQKMLFSPLLGGAKQIANADCVLFSLLGEHLELGETKQLLDTVGQLVKPDAQLVVNAGECAALGKQVMLSCVTVKFELDDLADMIDELTGGKQANKNRSSEQMLFKFDSKSRGIMESTARTIENGEDLDLPTYQRRQRTIDLGREVRETER